MLLLDCRRCVTAAAGAFGANWTRDYASVWPLKRQIPRWGRTPCVSAVTVSVGAGVADVYAENVEKKLRSDEGTQLGNTSLGL